LLLQHIHLQKYPESGMLLHIPVMSLKVALIDLRIFYLFVYQAFRTPLPYKIQFAAHLAIYPCFLYNSRINNSIDVCKKQNPQKGFFK